MQETANKLKGPIQIVSCPECGEEGDVIRAHDEDGDALLDTFVVVHDYGYAERYPDIADPTEITIHCGPFLWAEIYNPLRAHGKKEE